MARSRSGRSVEHGRLPELRDVVGQVEREPAIVLPERFEPAPHDLARSRQRVEIRRLVALDARRQDLGLENRRDERRALQPLDRIEQRIEAGAPAHDALPVRDEPSEHRRLDRFDLMTKLRERAAANRLQDVGIAPLASGAARTELAFDQSAAAESSFSSASAMDRPRP